MLHAVLQPQAVKAQDDRPAVAETEPEAGGETAPPTPTPPPAATPQSIFMKAAEDAQAKLKAALEAKDPARAETAAEELAAALEALRIAPSAQELRIQAKALADRAKRYEGDVPEALKAELDALVTVLAPLRGEGTAQYLENSAKTLRELVDKTQIGEGDTPASLKSELETLVAKLAKLRGTGEVAFLEQEATRLAILYGDTTTTGDENAAPHKALIKVAIDRLRHISPPVAAESLGEVVTSVTANAADVYEPAWADVEFRQKIGAAATALDGEFSKQLWVQYFNDRAKTIADGVLGTGTSDEDKRKAAYARERLVADANAMAQAARLKTAVEVLAGGYRPAIHIMAAKFGDIYVPNGSSRMCDATLGMRTACQRKTECDLPDDYKTSLCGYDPAPTAEDRIKAVTVYYACFTGGDPVWDELAARPGRDPSSGALLTTHHPAVSKAELRGTINKLRCPSERASAGGSGQ